MGLMVFMLKLTCLLGDWVFSVRLIVGFAGGKEGAGGSGGPMVTPAGGGGGGFPWRMAALQKSLEGWSSLAQSLKGLILMKPVERGRTTDGSVREVLEWQDRFAGFGFGFKASSLLTACSGAW